MTTRAMTMRAKTMTKRIHPAARARTVTGATSFLALVGIVTGFQFAANAETNGVASGAAAAPGTTAAPQAIDPATGQPVAPSSAPVAEAVPAPAADAGAVVPVAELAAAPAAEPVAAPVAAPEAAPAPAPAPVVAPAPAPVNGTTAGSGG